MNIVSMSYVFLLLFQYLQCLECCLQPAEEVLLQLLYFSMYSWGEYKTKVLEMTMFFFTIFFVLQINVKIKITYIYCWPKTPVPTCNEVSYSFKICS